MVSQHNKSLTVANFLCSFGASLVLVAFLSGRLFWWETNGLPISPSGSYLLFGAFGIILISAILQKGKVLTLRLVPSGFAAGLLILFLSDWLCRGYNLLQGPLIRGEIILGSIITIIILRKKLSGLINWFLPLAIVICIWSFFEISDGRLLFSDDHATFFYRLALLREHFPDIPFYNSLWNGGIDSRDFFATGALNLFLLASPLVYSFELKEVYNLIIVLLLFVFVPLMSVAAARAEKLPAPGPAIAGLLAMTSSLIWYRWALKYGTVGFITSASILPFIIALTANILSRERNLTALQAVLYIVFFSLMLLWSASGIVFIPLIIWSFVHFKRIAVKKYTLIIGVLLILINLPWISVFWTASNVSSFLASETEVSTSIDAEALNSEPEDNRRKYKHKTGGIDLNKSLKILRETSISINPLLLLLSIPGLFLLIRSSRSVYLITSIWVLLLGTILVPVKPQLELDRMLVILSLILCVPTAKTIQSLFEKVSSTEIKWTGYVLPAVVGGFLFASPFSTASIILSRSSEQYFFKDPVVPEMIQAIRRNAEDGRTLYSGCVVHQLSGGHLAPLILETHSPLIASSHVHNIWWYTDVIPTEFRSRKDEGVEEYFDFYNISTVFAHEPFWRKYFDSRKDEYKEVWRGGPFRLYKRLKFESNYFIEGTGEIINQGQDKLRLRVDSEQVIIKFNYLPFLKSSHCEISGEAVSDSLTFIKLNNCTPGTTVTIDAKSGFIRVADGIKASFS